MEPTKLERLPTTAATVKMAEPDLAAVSIPSGTGLSKALVREAIADFEREFPKWKGLLTATPVVGSGDGRTR